MTQQGSLFDAPAQLAEPSGERALVIDVHGDPVPQGSGKAILSKSTGRPFMKRDDTRLLPWRQQIGQTALAELAARGVGGVLLDGPVRLVVRFRMQRRKSWGKRTRLADVAVRPDFDKLVRSVADALTNVVYGDDGQITTAVIQKRPCRPGEPPGVEIAVGADTDDTCE
jgi:Holliday junction resolvase RusA-like endonuclease